MRDFLAFWYVMLVLFLVVIGAQWIDEKLGLGFEGHPLRAVFMLLGGTWLAIVIGVKAIAGKTNETEHSGNADSSPSYDAEDTEEATHEQNRSAGDIVRHAQGSFLGMGLNQFDDRMKDHFGNTMGRINDKGSIRGSDIFEVEVGHVDDDGKVFDDRGPWKEEIGRIDDKGNFIEKS